MTNNNRWCKIVNKWDITILLCQVYNVSIEILYDVWILLYFNKICILMCNLNIFRCFLDSCIKIWHYTLPSLIILWPFYFQLFDSASFVLWQVFENTLLSHYENGVHIHLLNNLQRDFFIFIVIVSVCIRKPFWWYKQLIRSFCKLQYNKI